jgi:hypothetical protein
MYDSKDGNTHKQSYKQAWIRPGPTVVSDQGAAFNHMSSIVGGDRLTVNHSKTFVSPEGVNSNSRVRESLVESISEAPCSTNEECLFRNVAQYMWEAWFTDGTCTMKIGMFFLAMYNKYGFN